MVVHKTHYSLENFHGASGRGHHILYTASDLRGKLSQSAEKSRKFSPSKVLPYMVSCIFTAAGRSLLKLMKLCLIIIKYTVNPEIFDGD